MDFYSWIHGYRDLRFSCMPIIVSQNLAGSLLAPSLVAIFLVLVFCGEHIWMLQETPGIKLMSTLTPTEYLVVVIRI
jgi:hypothetical protein